jgi:DNA-binding LytR/AlgR family response regulator
MKVLIVEDEKTLAYEMEIFLKKLFSFANWRTASVWVSKK